MQGNPDGALFVQFFTKPVEMKARSEKEGRPIFEDRDFIRIQIPGDDTTMVERQIKDEDKARFPSAWAAYQTGRDVPLDGTPVDQWPAISRSQAEELKRLNCRTLEQLCALSDQQAKKCGMGVFELRAKAKAFLEVSKDAAAAQRYAADYERMRADIESRDNEIRKLTAMVEALQQQMASRAA